MWRLVSQFVHTSGSSADHSLIANLDTEKGGEHVAVDVRLCQECRRTLFFRQDFAADVARKTPLSRSYANLVQFERGIRMLLPRFQKLLGTLQDPHHPPSNQQVAEAAKVRKRLTDSFTQYDVAARRIRDLATDQPGQKKLQVAIWQQATNFLHLHMLPLKSLPKILKNSVSPASERNESDSIGRFNSAQASGRRSASVDNAGQLSSDRSSQISALETEEKALSERLIVLEEQKFFVQEMVAQANRHRKFDEVAALAGNVEEISKEIDGVQNMLSGLDFESAYTGVLSPRPKPLG